jgi:hypothetical protein
MSDWTWKDAVLRIALMSIYYPLMLIIFPFMFITEKLDHKFGMTSNSSGKGSAILNFAGVSLLIALSFYGAVGFIGWTIWRHFH